MTASDGRHPAPLVPPSHLLGANRHALLRSRGALILAVLACDATARAQPAAPQQALELDWHAPPDCPTRAQVLERIENYLGGTGGDGSLAAHARISREGPDYALRLSVRSDAGTARRELTDRDCDALAESGALLIALAMDPSPPAPQAPAGANARGQPSGGDVAGPTDPAPPAQLPWSWAAGVGLALGLGLLPDGPSPQLAALVRAHRAPLRLGLELTLLLPRESSASAYAPARLWMGGALGGGRVCFELALGRVALGACAVGELGVLFSRVRGIEEPRGRQTPWFAGGGGVELTHELDRDFSWFLRAEALLSSDQRRFVIETPAAVVELHRISSLVGRATAGVLYAF